MPLPQNKRDNAQVLLGMVHQSKKWFPMLCIQRKVITSLIWKTCKYGDTAALSAEIEDLKNYLKTVDPGHPIELYTDRLCPLGGGYVLVET